MSFSLYLIGALRRRVRLGDFIVGYVAAINLVFFQQLVKGAIFLLAHRLRHAHGSVGVVHRFMRREFHAQLLGNRAQPKLTGKLAHLIHIDELRIRKTEVEGREGKTAALQIEVLYVVANGVADHQSIGRVQ